MTELVLSDITRMAGGFCVIGLERSGHGCRSIRPLPPRGYAWPALFPYGRGDKLQIELWPLPLVRPHLEDRQARDRPRLLGRLSEEELVAWLRKAEVASRLKDFFACELHESPAGGDSVWAHPSEASRSICGGEFDNIRFHIHWDKLRVDVSRSSGEALRGLPLVDREWNEFVEQAMRRIRGTNLGQRLQRFLNSRIQRRILQSPERFGRIGLTRPLKGRCWLMLDSLFPQPQNVWLEELS